MKMLILFFNKQAGVEIGCVILTWERKRIQYSKYVDVFLPLTYFFSFLSYRRMIW